MINPLMQARAGWWKEGRIYVMQNMVGPYLGQEHRHNKRDFLKWCESAEKDGWKIMPDWRTELPKSKKAAKSKRRGK